MRRRGLALLLCLCALLSLIGCGGDVPTAPEEEKEDGLWPSSAVPALYHEGRFYHWQRIFYYLPHEEGAWKEVGEIAGVSRSIQPQEGYFHAAKEMEGCYAIRIADEVRGTIWACEDFPDVLYVYLSEGYQSKLWVGLAVEGLYRNIFCWDGQLYLAPDKVDSEALDTLPEGCTEEGKLLYDSPDRLPTESGALVGGWSGMAEGPYACLPQHLSSRVWRSETGQLYLEYLDGSQRHGVRSRYLPVRPLTAEEAGELTIPQQFLPLPSGPEHSA